MSAIAAVVVIIVSGVYKEVQCLWDWREFGFILWPQIYQIEIYS